MNLAAVDFLRASPQPRLGWCLLFVGMALFGAAMAVDRLWSAQRDEAARLEQLALTARQVIPKPVRAPEPTLAERRLQQARTELRRPWLATLSAIESATVDPVYLLSLTIEPATGAVKLEAEAPSFEKALAYIEMLGAGGALLPATLRSHTQATALPSDLPVVRFSVATHWNAR